MQSLLSLMVLHYRLCIFFPSLFCLFLVSTNNWRNSSDSLCLVYTPIKTLPGPITWAVQVVPLGFAASITFQEVSGIRISIYNSTYPQKEVGLKTEEIFPFIIFPFIIFGLFRAWSFLIWGVTSRFFSV